MKNINNIFINGSSVIFYFCLAAYFKSDTRHSIDAQLP